MLTVMPESQTSTNSTSKTGRTQEERSAAMRQRLLDATIECLAEYGYAGTTTTRVAERAGVTRGAQVHHFRTKADLVSAAIRHVASKRSEQAEGEMERVRQADDPLDAALDLLWEIHKGPVFTATMELWVAARTDAEMREHLTEVEPAVTSLLIGHAKKLFGEHAHTSNFLHALYTTMDAIRGIMMSGFLLPGGEQELDKRWQRAKGQIRILLENGINAVEPRG